MHEVKFKIKIEPYFYATFFGYCLSAFAFMALSRFNWGLIKVYYWTFPIGMALSFGLAVLFRGIYATILTERQISGVTVLGFRKKMNLSEIDKVLPITLRVISFLRVFEKNRRTSIWLPMVHDNQEELESLVISRTDMGNPLRKYFEALRSGRSPRARVGTDRFRRGIS